MKACLITSILLQPVLSLQFVDQLLQMKWCQLQLWDYDDWICNSMTATAATTKPVAFFAPYNGCVFYCRVAFLYWLHFIIIGFPANNIISLKSLTTVPIRRLQFYSSKQVHSLQILPTRCALFKFNLHKSQSGLHVQLIDQRKYIKVHQHQVSQQAKFSKWCVCE